jgi:hypothetical protein
MVQGEGQGAAIYRNVVPVHGWALLAPCDPASVPARTHIVVVSDLAQLGGWRAQLSGADWHWEGNIAVRSVDRA